MSRVAIVTGGGSGIGLAIAARLAADGVLVVIADKVDGTSAADEIGATFVEANVASRQACRQLIEGTVADLGSIDIVVNNAGFQHVQPLDEFDEDTWDEMIGVMMTAPFLITRYAFPHMKAGGWGRIVNIGSIHSLVASPFKVGYVAAKHGLIGLTRSAALEGAEHGITVNAICPAYVRTPLVEQQILDQAAVNDMTAEDVVHRVMLEPAAIKKLIEPSEVAAAVSFLCSDDASSVTGAAWTMDLGWTAR